MSPDNVQDVLAAISGDRFHAPISNRSEPAKTAPAEVA
jgi:hypothetical protein